MIIFSGSRNLPKSNTAIVSEVVQIAMASNGSCGVGCASGLDSMVRNSPSFTGKVFKAASRRPSDLVARSAEMVYEARQTYNPALLFWPNASCPSNVRPSHKVSECFCGGGSGTWATAALAAGLRVQIFAFGVPWRNLPLNWGGSWSTNKRFPYGYFLVRNSNQLSLF